MVSSSSKPTIISPIILANETTLSAIATTGNAGPSKGDSNAKIGTVFIALATPDQVRVEEFDFGQPRDKVIDRTVNKSLEMVQKEILKNLL